MSIGLAASQREEHASLHDLAGVGVVRVERISDLGAADLATAGRLEELEEGQSHMYMEPEVLIRRYAPVENDGLGDLLPDGSGGQITAGPGPIPFAAPGGRRVHAD